MRTILVSILAVLAVGCATPQTFNERLLAGYATVTETRQTAVTLVDAKKMSSADAVNVQQQADTARAGLDLARSMRASAPQQAEDKLTATQTIVRALRAYLLSKEAK